MKYLKIAGIVFGVLILSGLAYGIVTYLRITGGELKDLGVRYTVADAERAIQEKAGVEVSDLSKVYFGSNFATEGQVRVEQTFTDAEISAIQNYANEKAGPFKQVQIKFIGDGLVEASGYVDDPRVTIPGRSQIIYNQHTIIASRGLHCSRSHHRKSQYRIFRLC